MADPLSIAAAVVGLLATAGKVCSVLSAFVSDVVDAPQTARDTLATVEEVRLALEMVKGLVDTVSTLPSRRRVLVRLDHIAITLSNCVLTLSELESLMCCFKDNILIRLRWFWLWSEKKVLRLLSRLEAQKTSLSLMVTVLMWYVPLPPASLSSLARSKNSMRLVFVSQSEMEALKSRERLNAAVEEILQRDEEFAARVQTWMRCNWQTAARCGSTTTIPWSTPADYPPSQQWKGTAPQDRTCYL